MRDTTTRRKFLAATGGAATASLAGCLSGGSSETIRIDGSSTVFPVSSAVAEQYSTQNAGVQVPVSKSGTGGGFQKFCNGETAINDASRRISSSEEQACSNAGVEYLRFHIALDGITVVVNPAADWVDCLTFQELASIWGPDNPPQQWSDVNQDWPSEEFDLFGPTSASGTFDFFTEEVIGEEGSSRSDYQPTENDNTIVTGVAGSEYAMGYFGYSFYSENQGKLKALSLDNDSGCVEPSPETINSGKYPLSRPLYIYVNRESLQRDAVESFVRFYLEQSSTDLISEAGYIPVSEQTKQDNLEKLDNAVSS